MVLDKVGVMSLVMEEVTMRRSTVPQAIGRIFPFGFSKGIILALAIALMVFGGTLLVARSMRVSVKAWRASGHL